MAKNAGEFCEEICYYLTNKIPTVPLGTVLEIAEHITCKMINYNNDRIRERDQEWKRQASKGRSH